MFKTSLLVFVFLFVSVMNVSAGTECLFPDNPAQSAPEWICGLGDDAVVGTGDSKIEAVFNALHEAVQNTSVQVTKNAETTSFVWKKRFGDVLVVKGASSLVKQEGKPDGFEIHNELLFQHNSCKIALSLEGTLSRSAFTISKEECSFKDFYQQLGNLGFSMQETMSSGGMHYVNLTFVDPGTK